MAQQQHEQQQHRRQHRHVVGRSYAQFIIMHLRPGRVNFVCSKHLSPHVCGTATESNVNMTEWILRRRRWQAVGVRVHSPKPKQKEKYDWRHPSQTNRQCIESLVVFFVLMWALARPSLAFLCRLGGPGREPCGSAAAVFSSYSLRFFCFEFLFRVAFVILPSLVPPPPRHRVASAPNPLQPYGDKTLVMHRLSC